MSRIKKENRIYNARRVITIEDAFFQFIIDKKALGLSEKTIKTYIYDFNTLGKYIDVSKPISAVHKRDFQEVFGKMSDLGLSRNTVRHYSATAKSFLSWCGQNGLCDVKIDLFKGEESVPKTYTQDELKRLLKRPNFAKCSFTELRNWTIINLLVNDGCRASTVRGIKICDVQLEDGALYLRQMKRRKTITVPLSDALVLVLRQYLKIRKGKPDEPLFCNEDGSEMTEAGLHSAITRYNHSRGVANTSIHAFRHTFARMYLVDCDGDALKLQRILGHSTLDMTRHYAKMFDADIIADRQRSPLEVLQQKKIKMR